MRDKGAHSSESRSGGGDDGSPDAHPAANRGIKRKVLVSLPKLPYSPDLEALLADLLIGFHCRKRGSCAPAVQLRVLCPLHRAPLKPQPPPPSTSFLATPFSDLNESVTEAVLAIINKLAHSAIAPMMSLSAAAAINMIVGKKDY